MELSKFMNYLDYDCIDTIDNPAITYPFQLDHFQKHAHYRTSKNENVLVTAHTGSGKTVVAEFHMVIYWNLKEVKLFTKMMI